MTFLALLFAACGVGFLAGFVIACVMAGAGSINLWEVTTLDGDIWWFTDPGDVHDFVRDRGLVAVRKLRVLT